MAIPNPNPSLDQVPAISSIEGITTKTGSTTTLIDQTKNWSPNQWFGCMINIFIGSQVFSTTISGNTATVLTLYPPLTIQVLQGSPYKIQNQITTIASGQMRPGITLTATQQFVTFSYVPQSIVITPYVIPWIQPVLASGASAHFINESTGLATPYTFPAGFTLMITEKGIGFNQDCEIVIYFDGLLAAIPIVSFSGQNILESNVISLSSTVLDPTAASGHTVDAVLINKGLGNMEGAGTLTCILEAVHTPPFPDEKDTQCPFCKNINHVPVHTTWITCSSCGKLYFTADHTIRRK